MDSRITIAARPRPAEAPRVDPRFEIAAGTIPGRRHLGRGPLLVGRNNQDAFAFRQGPAGTVAAVCDGCSGGGKSEVGATLGARWAVAAAWEELVEGRRSGAPGDPQAALERVRRRCLARLRLLAGTLGQDLGAALEEALLFTVVLCALTPRRILVAAVGDGLVAINGEVQRLGPFPGNAPPYLGYGLLDEPPEGMRPEDLRFRLLADRPLEEVEHLLIGTDGAEDYLRAEGALLPGRAEALGPLARLWTDDRFFEGPDALRRRLALANSEHLTWDAATGRPHVCRGLLPDDTTLVVLRRRSRAIPGPEGRAP